MDCVGLQVLYRDLVFESYTPVAQSAKMNDFYLLLFPLLFNSMLDFQSLLMFFILMKGIYNTCFI